MSSVTDVLTDASTKRSLLAASTAAAGAPLVVVGFTGTPPETPPSVHLIRLTDDHPLAAEWSVLVPSQAGCGGLVALDEGSVRAEVPERILRDEMFAGWWRILPDASTRDRLEHPALTDPLTGAYNRRFLERYLDRIGPRAPSLGAIAFDFDGFKAVSDTWGHSIGDAALRGFADLAHEQNGSTELLVRLGGDEWLLLAPDVGIAMVRERARKALRGLERMRLPAPAHEVVLRASAGAGVYAAPDLDPEAVGRALDAATDAGGGLMVEAGSEISLLM